MNPLDELKKADLMRPIHPEAIRLEGWGKNILAEWSGPDRGWQSDVSTDGDGAAAGNIVRDEWRKVATYRLGWHYTTERRTVAVNGGHFAASKWEENATA
jgi:hypothetical protein